ncbi:portal protein [Bradyrhizobium sp. 62]|uniref:portal protein n=1 Tax=Bradyrhizobium sp. 62 TaxID=1043588 RepID=UPI001FF802D4|nr:portal protein [Bradyrhizobium sp. 62]MCK1367633.1 head-tail connector protein [Bradyrhizobium sp. 62]
MSQVIDVLERNKSLCTKRDIWLPMWQSLADMYYPNRGGFTFPILQGQETQTEIYDTTPMLARRGLATAIDGLLKPSTTRWFWMKAKDEAINEDDQAKAWFDAVGDRMWSAIYDPLARFIQHSGAVDNDLAALGLGYLWIGENRNRDGLNFRSIHIGDCAIDENADGQVDTIYITRKWTARQAFQRFGEKAGKKALEALKEENGKHQGKMFEYVQAIYPREDRDERYKNNLNMPFANCIVSKADETLVEESGFQEFPVAIPRWECAPGEIYPRSPGMMALPDARTLQAMGHTLLVGGQRAVDPPTWVVDDAVLSAVRTFPGGLTVIDSEAARSSGGKPIGQLEMGANIPIGREMQDDYRKMVGNSFFKEVFTLPTDQNMTATEVMERKEEFIRTIGPTMGQLENDYIGVIVRRVFGILLRASVDVKGNAIEGGPIPPAPDVLQNREAEFEFMSPIQQARKAIEAHAIAASFQVIGPVLQIKPESADNIDGDEIVRDWPDMFNLPHKYIMGVDRVQAARQARQQQAAGPAMVQGAQGVADVVKTVADAHAATAKGNAAKATEVPA